LRLNGCEDGGKKQGSELVGRKRAVISKQLGSRTLGIHVIYISEAHGGSLSTVRRLCTQPADTELYLCGVERGRGREREREGGRSAQFL
jgi:hypothetical protein